MSVESLTNISNKRDYDKSFTAEYDGDITDRVVITPSTGKKVKITGVRVSTEGATSAGQKVRVTLNDDTVYTFFPTTTPQTDNDDAIYALGDAGDTVQVTSTLGAGKNFFISIKYREE